MILVLPKKIVNTRIFEKEVHLLRNITTFCEDVKKYTKILRGCLGDETAPSSHPQSVRFRLLDY